MYTNPGNNGKNQGERLQYTFSPSTPNYYSSEYTSQNAPYQNYAPPKKKKHGGMVALMIVICLFCTIAGGAAGGYLVYMNQPAYSADIGDIGDIDGNSNINNDNSSILPETTPPVNPVPGQTASSTAQIYSPSEIYSICNPAVVAISTETTQYNVFGQAVQIPAAGSGFIITEDGYIVTNAHVISGANKVTVYLYDGTGYDAMIVGKDEDEDLAVLKIEKTGLKYVVFGDSEIMKVGDSVVAIGNPLGELNNSLTAGVVSALDRAVNIEGTPMTMMQTDASISPGNSGGPLFNNKAEVIGVVSAKSISSGAEGIGFAIPSNQARGIVDQLINFGYVQGKPKLGVIIDTSYTSAAARYYNMPEGAYVSAVDEGSCAEKAGIKVGDVIISLGDTQVKDIEGLQNALKTYKAGDSTTVKVNRQGTEMNLNVILDEKRDVAEPPRQQGSTENSPRDPFGIYGYRDEQNGGGA